MLIEVKNISQPVQVGNYRQLECMYFSDNGRLNTKKIVDFKDKEVFETLLNSHKGEKFEVDVQKDGKWYNWVGIRSAANLDPAPKETTKGPAMTTGQVVKGSNYETPAEREWNRTRIGRQACLNTAVALLSVGQKAPLALNDVIAVAAELEMWVTRKQEITHVDQLADDLIE